MNTIIIAGFLGSLGAGLATGLGGLPLLLMRQPSEEQQNILLGFAAGVMLAASFFSLILPALEAAEQRGASRSLASAQVVGAVLIGAFAIASLSKWLPSLAESASGAAEQSTRRMWLFPRRSCCTICRRGWQSASALAVATSPPGE